MKKSLIIFVALLACVAVVGSTRGFVPASSAAQDAKAQPASPVEERIRRVAAGLVPAVVVKGTSPAMPLAERMKFYKVPGVSVAVVSGGRVEWARGFGVKDVATNEPVTTETLFQAGSISKPVAALAALRLVQDGRLSLDEDVNARLVSWKLPENEFTREKKVTLRRLLTHSAGLTVHGFPGYAEGAQVPTLVQVLNGEKPANTAAIRVDTVPGTLWRYSGGGYTIMQQMLVDVAKKPFPDIVKQLVLDPAGMKHSTYEQPLPPPRAKDAPREREVAKVDPKIYESYVGDFEFKINPQLTVVLGVSTEGGKLLVQQNGGAKREWLPASETEFFSLASPNTLAFVKDAQGAVGEVTIKQGGETYTGKRIK